MIFIDYNVYTLTGNDSTQTVTTLTRKSMVMVRWTSQAYDDAGNGQINADNLFSANPTTRVPVSTYTSGGACQAGLSIVPSGSVIRFTETNVGLGHLIAEVHVFALPENP